VLQGDQAAPLAALCQLLKVVHSLEMPHKMESCKSKYYPYMRDFFTQHDESEINPCGCVHPQFLAVAEKYFTVWIYHIFFISLLMNTFFQFLNIVIEVPMNILIHIFFAGSL